MITFRAKDQVTGKQVGITISRIHIMGSKTVTLTVADEESETILHHLTIDESQFVEGLKRL